MNTLATVAASAWYLTLKGRAVGLEPHNIGGNDAAILSN